MSFLTLTLAPEIAPVLTHCLWNVFCAALPSPEFNHLFISCRSLALACDLLDLLWFVEDIQSPLLWFSASLHTMKWMHRCRWLVCACRYCIPPFSPSFPAGLFAFSFTVPFSVPVLYTPHRWCWPMHKGWDTMHSLCLCLFLDVLLFCTVSIATASVYYITYIKPQAMGFSMNSVYYYNMNSVYKE